MTRMSLWDIIPRRLRFPIPHFSQFFFFFFFF
ncbi:hypothetical protein ACKS23_10070 [Histoplasma ohiense]